MAAAASVGGSQPTKKDDRVVFSWYVANLGSTSFGQTHWEIIHIYGSFQFQVLLDHFGNIVVKIPLIFVTIYAKNVLC